MIDPDEMVRFCLIIIGQLNQGHFRLDSDNPSCLMIGQLNKDHHDFFLFFPLIMI